MNRKGRNAIKLPGKTKKQRLWKKGEITVKSYKGYAHTKKKVVRSKAKSSEKRVKSRRQFVVCMTAALFARAERHV